MSYPPPDMTAGEMQRRIKSQEGVLEALLQANHHMAGILVRVTKSLKAATLTLAFLAVAQLVHFVTEAL